MAESTSNTLRRNDPTTSNPAELAALYVRSYLFTRTVVGVLAIVLPLIFIVGEAYFLRGGVQLRGSISAYYHTSMRDIFVGVLCVTGILLMTYLSSETNKPEFWYSLVAGVAVIGVALLPTQRPGLPVGAPMCGTTPVPDGCSPVQQAWGETLVASIHFAAAAIFILCLARISFLFAREGGRTMALIQRICGSIILLAVVWVAVGETLNTAIGGLTPLYIGEVAAIWAFGTSWLLEGKGLRLLLGMKVT